MSLVGKTVAAGRGLNGASGEYEEQFGEDEKTLTRSIHRRTARG
jgi:hypothetical protein